MKRIPQIRLIPLIVIGNGNEKYTTFLKGKIKEFELQNFVLFLGSVNVKELKYLYKKAEFLCLPSFYEGFGIPIIEALSCGIPVLTSNTSAMPEAAGSCGLLIDPNSISELSFALNEMINNPTLMKGFRNYIPHQLSKFDGVSTSIKLLDIYKNL